MKEYTVTEFLNLYDIIKTYDTKNVLYRGHTKQNYLLHPKVGRLVHSKQSRLILEKELLRLFKERSIIYLDQNLINNWEWLALGQHYGLPTRFLDWTRNPLIAAYFAVENENDGSSVIYVNKAKGFVDINEIDPFEISTVERFIPSYLTQRIHVQSGVFTVHNDPELPLEDNAEYSKNLEKITIEKSFRKELKNILYRFGIHRASLFPDLDGLSNHIEWLLTKKY